MQRFLSVFFVSLFFSRQQNHYFGRQQQHQCWSLLLLRKGRFILIFYNSDNVFGIKYKSFIQLKVQKINKNNFFRQYVCCAPDGADRRLKLFQMSLLDPTSVLAPIKGAVDVLHLESPLSADKDPKVNYLMPLFLNQP